MIGMGYKWIGFQTQWRSWYLALSKGRLEDLAEAARPIVGEKKGALKLLESRVGKADYCSQLHPLM